MFNAMFHGIFVIIILGGASVTVTRNSKNAFAELCSDPFPRSTVEKGAYCGGR